jgi:CubicO group peptidase (beta-lactamase class C family)
MKKRLSLLFLPTAIFPLLFFGFNAEGQNTPTAKQIKELEKTISLDMKTSGAPGAVIAVMQNGKIVYEKPFGVVNISTKELVNINTVFQAASVTKTFTALALLTVFEQKGINVNSPVGNVIKDLPPKVSSISFHQLLSHSGGIIDASPGGRRRKEGVVDFYKRIGDNMVFTEPGQVGSYSNAGFALAGELLSTMKALYYEDAVDSIILSPLQMKSSTFNFYKTVLQSYSIGHSIDSAGRAKVQLLNVSNPMFQPAGGLFSNVYDLCRFADCFMNNGMLEGKQLISAEVIKKMSTPYTEFGLLHEYLGYPGSYYGYGLINFTNKGIHFLGHSGEANFQNTLFAMAPEQKTAIIIFSNTGKYPFFNSFEKAVEIFLPAGKDNSKPETPFIFDTEIIGKYYFPGPQGTKNPGREIFKKENKLFIRFINPEFKFPDEVKFFPDKTGKIKYMSSVWRAWVKLD